MTPVLKEANKAFRERMDADLKKAQNMPEHIDWAHGTHPRAVKEAEALAEGIGSMSTL